MNQDIDTAPTTRASVGHDVLAVRAELHQQRRIRSEQLDELTADAAEAVATGDDQQLQVVRVLRMAADAALVEIDAALGRLADGSYGICQRCAEPIPAARLEVVPVTRLCSSCQHITESGRGNDRRRGQRRWLAGPR